MAPIWWPPRAALAESFQKESGIPVTFLGANTPVGLAAGDDA